jgi:hypothetical protein
VEVVGEREMARSTPCRLRYSIEEIVVADS